MLDAKNRQSFERRIEQILVYYKGDIMLIYTTSCIRIEMPFKAS